MNKGRRLTTHRVVVNNIRGGQQMIPAQHPQITRTFVENGHVCGQHLLQIWTSEMCSLSREVVPVECRQLDVSIWMIGGPESRRKPRSTNVSN